MKIGQSLLGLSVVLVVAVLLPSAQAKVGEEVGEAKKRVPKQIYDKPSVVDSDEDHKTAETGFGAAGAGGHGKYFQYQHNPEHDHYEFGYRRGNDHHFQERYEKAHPHEGKFKTKVRWGDKKGGYGEHYYDYNHAGHGHGDDGGDGGGGGSNDGGEGGYSEPVPDYKPVNEYKHKSKRNTNKQAATSASVADAAPAASQVAQKRASKPDFTQLVFDVASGLVIDEVTGQTYSLRAVN